MTFDESTMEAAADENGNFEDFLRAVLRENDGNAPCAEAPGDCLFAPDADHKRQERLKRNRASAKESRLRARAQAKILKERNARLELALAHATHENNTLKVILFGHPGPLPPAFVGKVPIGAERRAIRAPAAGRDAARPTPPGDRGHSPAAAPS